MDRIGSAGDQLSLTGFQRCVGSCFRVQVDQGGTIDLTLVEATALLSRALAPRESPFCLIFSGPAERRLNQGIYAFEQSAIGTFEMFIVPIAPDAHGPRYEAVFN